MKLTFTDRARDMVSSFMDTEEDGLQALRIAVDGSPFAPSYELTLVDAETRAEADVEVDAGVFTVLVDEGSVKRLDGAVVDFVEDDPGERLPDHPGPGCAQVGDGRRRPERGARRARLAGPRHRDKPRHRRARWRNQAQGRPGHRDLHRDGGGMPGVRDVADDAAAGRRAHGPRSPSPRSPRFTT